IRTPDGRIIALRTVADISTRYVADEIERIDRSRVAVITADVDKAIAAPAEIIASIDAQLLTRLQQDYPGLTIQFGGEAQEEAETTNSLKGAFLVALIAIYALLAIPLKSYLQPLMIMSAIPFGVIGALLGHWLHGIPLSLLSLFGILALSGVVVNDSLLLISRYNENRLQGKPARLAMVEAGCGRMRAIVLTSITTYAGLVPLIWETAENAQFLIPAAVAMGYGILFATLITLILIPALVVISEDLN
ncbi:MAG: efflux RND transporter permease subunit, partial [Amphritea sp.]|nr:efflux RND transporter permease subunit [Amphritea sp.]